jgi:predicted peroxiredoxin
MTMHEGRRSLVVKSGAGDTEPERCVQALTVSATAVAAGAAVSLWLMGEAVTLAVPGGADAVQVDLAPPTDSLLAAVMAGGSVTVCAQCAARRGIVGGELLTGVRIAGAAAYVEEILAPTAQALIY